MNNHHTIINKNEALFDLYELIRHEIRQSQRPANEVILDDNDVMDILKISKRKLQYLKSDGILGYHTLPGSPRTYYYLSDILEILNENRVSPVRNRIAKS